MGYPFAQKRYKVLNLSTKQVFVSRDVHFIENVFPSKDLSSASPTSLFSFSPSHINDDSRSFTNDHIDTDISQQELLENSSSPTVEASEINASEASEVHSSTSDPRRVLHDPPVRPVRVKKKSIKI